LPAYLNQLSTDIYRIEEYSGAVMKIETETKKENPLMKREEAWIKVEHEGKPTPPRREILAEVAKHIKAKEDCVIIDKIFTEAGRGASKVRVLVYPKADAVPKAKLEKMKSRMEKKSKAAQAAQPAEAGAKKEEGGAEKVKEKKEKKGDGK
jgi:ribosomal protein S24E